MRLSRQVVLRVVAAAALALIGYGHYDLWQNAGYKHALPVAQLFLLTFGGGIILALALLVGPRRIVAFLGAGMAALTLLAYGLSRGPGVPTFHGTWKETGLAPQGFHLLGIDIDITLMIAEGVGILACAALFFLKERVSSPQRRGAPIPSAA